jgi:hypothetical protein
LAHLGRFAGAAAPRSVNRPVIGCSAGPLRPDLPVITETCETPDSEPPTLAIGRRASSVEPRGMGDAPRCMDLRITHFGGDPSPTIRARWGISVFV